MLANLNNNLIIKFKKFNVFCKKCDNIIYEKIGIELVLLKKCVAIILQKKGGMRKIIFSNNYLTKTSVKIQSFLY